MDSLEDKRIDFAIIENPQSAATKGRAYTRDQTLPKRRNSKDVGLKQLNGLKNTLTLSLPI